MTRRYRSPLLAAAAVSLSLFASGALAAYVGGGNYRSFADSPFSGLSFPGYFHLEDFEDQSLSTPGVSASGGTVTSLAGFSGTIIDSVDADDGAVNGSCNKSAAAFVACDSLFGSGGTGISFTFDAGALGMLPTHVGIVWTDGINSVRLEAFDAASSSLGVFGPFDVAGTGFSDQDVLEDTFVGVIEPGGISRILITSGAGGGIEVDHLQYGAGATPTVPEPTPLALLALALILMLVIQKRRRAI